MKKQIAFKGVFGSALSSNEEAEPIFCNSFLLAWHVTRIIGLDMSNNLH